MRLFPIFAKVIKSFFNHGTLYERHGGVSQEQSTVYHIMDVAKQMENN